MKKNYIAHLVLGMALLGSSLMGYGMEKQLEQEEYRVSKRAFKECLEKYFFLKEGKNAKTNFEVHLETLLSSDHHKKHFEADRQKIKEGLDKDYKQAKEFFQDNDYQRVLLEKAQIYLKNLDVNNINDIEAFCKKNSQELSDFLDFLSKEKDLIQELPKHLKKLQGTKNGVFNEKDKDQCAQQLSKVVLDFLDPQNKEENNSIRCKFYERIEKGDNWFYCMAYVNLEGFVKDSVGNVKNPQGEFNVIGDIDFYHWDPEKNDLVVKAKPTNTLVMVFRKDSKASTKVYLKHAYPYLGRDAFLEAGGDKAGDQNPDNLAKKEKKSEGEDQKKSDEKCKGFFGVSLEEEISSLSLEEQLEEDDEICEDSFRGQLPDYPEVDKKNAGNSKKGNANLGVYNKYDDNKKIVVKSKPKKAGKEKLVDLVDLDDL
jgi:hypothetical protein